MTTITEQARVAAEEIARRWFDGDLPERAQLQSLAREQLTTLVEEVLKRVRPASVTEAEERICVACDKPAWAHACDRPPLSHKCASVTEAIDCVKRLRDEWESVLVNNDGEALFWQRKALAADEIIEALESLESLQGKAGVNENQRGVEDAIKIDKQQWFYKYIRADLEEVQMGPYTSKSEANAAAKAHASFGATVTNAYSVAATTPASVEAPLELTDEKVDVETVNKLKSLMAAPEQQSPRVCVECKHNNLAFDVCQEQVDVGNLTPIQIVELHQEFWDAGILRCGCKCVFPD